MKSFTITQLDADWAEFAKALIDRYPRDSEEDEEMSDAQYAKKCFKHHQKQLVYEYRARQKRFEAVAPSEDFMTIT